LGYHPPMSWPRKVLLLSEGEPSEAFCFLLGLAQNSGAVNTKATITAWLRTRWPHSVLEFHIHGAEPGPLHRHRVLCFHFPSSGEHEDDPLRDSVHVGMLTAAP
jgi:hypothetical protein